MLSIITIIIFLAWLATTAYAFMIAYHTKLTVHATLYGRLFWKYGIASPYVIAGLLICLTIYGIVR